MIVVWERAFVYERENACVCVCVDVEYWIWIRIITETTRRKKKNVSIVNKLKIYNSPKSSNHTFF